MSDQYETIRRLGEMVDQKINKSIWVATAIVEEVNRNNKKIRVKILPDERESGWIRLYALNAGDNYFSGVLPEIGAEVILLFIGGNPNSAIALCGNLKQDEEDAPAGVSDNDIFIMHKDGHMISITSTEIKIEGSVPVKLNAPQFIFNNGTKPAAALGDDVMTPVGPGKIIGGNTSFLI